MSIKSRLINYDCYTILTADSIIIVMNTHDNMIQLSVKF